MQWFKDGYIGRHNIFHPFCVVGAIAGFEIHGEQTELTVGDGKRFASM